MRYPFFIFVALLLFVYSDRIVEPYLVPRTLFWSLSVGAVCLFFLYKKVAIPSFSAATKVCISALFGLAAWSWLSVLWAHDSTLVLPTALQYSLMAFTFWAFCIIKKEKMLAENDVLYAIVGLATIAVAVLGRSVVEGLYLQKSISVISDHIGFLFGNKNLAASFLYLVLPFLLVFTIKNNELLGERGFSPLTKTLAYALIFSIIAIIWFTQCRSVWLGIVLVGVFIPILLFLYKNEQKNLLLTTIFIFPFLIFITLWNLENLTWLTNSNTISTRLEVWKNTILMIYDHPFLGVGAGNWQIFFPKYGLATLGGATEAGRLVFQRPHNDFLWLWSELGFVGIGCYILLFATLFFVGTAAAKHSLKAAIYTAFLFGYCAIAFADFPLERIEHQIVFCMLAAEIVLQEEQISFDRISGLTRFFGSFLDKIAGLTRFFSFCRNWKLSNFTLIFGVFIAIFSLCINVFRYNSEIAMRKIYAAHEVGDWQSMAKNVQNAQNPFYHFDPMTTPLTWYAGLACAGQGDFVGAQQQFETAAAQHPYHINTLNNLGSAHQVQGNIPKAIEYYEKALACSPHFDETLLNLSATYLLSHNKTKAEYYFNKCRIDTTQGSRYHILSDSLGRK